LPQGIWSNREDTEKISMAPALRMTRSIIERLRFFFVFFVGVVFGTSSLKPLPASGTSLLSKVVSFLRATQSRSCSALY